MLHSWRQRRPQGFAVFSLPAAHHRRMRTSNARERVNQEIKRRTRVASLFPNESSLLRPRLRPALRDQQRAALRKNLPQHEPCRHAPKLTRNFYRKKKATHAKVGGLC